MPPKPKKTTRARRATRTDLPEVRVILPAMPALPITHYPNNNAHTSDRARGLSHDERRLAGAYLPTAEHARLSAFCERYGVRISDVIRARLSDIIGSD